MSLNGAFFADRSDPPGERFNLTFTNAVWSWMAPTNVGPDAPTTDVPLVVLVGTHPGLAFDEIELEAFGPDGESLGAPVTLMVEVGDGTLNAALPLQYAVQFREYGLHRFRVRSGGTEVTVALDVR